MNRVAVISAFPVSPQMVAEFVTEQGGHWFDEGRGSLEQDGGVVFFDADARFNKEIFEDRDVENLRALLGAEPQTHIELCSPRDPASQALATRIARILVQRYGGLFREEHESF